MLRHKAGDEVINFALPACNRHAAIVGEWKANVKKNQSAHVDSPPAAMARVERTLLSAALALDFGLVLDSPTTHRT
jgi:hypothetical protein